MVGTRVSELHSIQYIDPKWSASNDSPPILLWIARFNPKASPPNLLHRESNVSDTLDSVPVAGDAPGSKESPMSQEILLSDQEIAGLRDAHYNATIIERIDVHSDLARFRVRPDHPVPAFEPGQYVALGLGLWEPRMQGTQTEDVPAKKITKIVRRAYSISCPILDANSQLAPCDEIDYLEFYITLVRRAGSEDQKPPVLTPRLFLKNAGDRMVVESRIVGHYTLGDIDPQHTVLFIGTGTGEAPHNAMLTHLLRHGHTGKIIHATSVRNQHDLGYAAEHAVLAARYANYRYIPLTTREPHNLDEAHPKYVGKQYMQQYFASGELAKVADDPLDPKSTHVFLCGNPSMIGYVAPGTQPPRDPGMLQILTAAGFTDEHGCHGPGCIRFEKYW